MKRVQRSQCFRPWYGWRLDSRRWSCSLHLMYRAGLIRRRGLDQVRLAQDVWFHVDKLSSAHVYLRMPDGMSWESIPEDLLNDCAQLVKANSIEESLLNPGFRQQERQLDDHLHASRQSEGLSIVPSFVPILSTCLEIENRGHGSGSSFIPQRQEGFSLPYLGQTSDSDTYKVHVPKRQNPIVNRLNKTKVEKVVDHEQEKIDRIMKESAIRRAAAAQKKKADAELAKQREAEKAAKSYDSLFEVEEDFDANAPRKTGRELEEDFM
ncbi:Coiled-coil domain-containing protein [Salix suchowensis]|nr:Coiled-coil domain-containing protein [Salix suchowensis]